MDIITQMRLKIAIFCKQNGVMPTHLLASQKIKVSLISKGLEFHQNFSEGCKFYVEGVKIVFIEDFFSTSIVCVNEMI